MTNNSYQRVKSSAAIHIASWSLPAASVVLSTLGFWSLFGDDNPQLKIAATATVGGLLASLAFLQSKQVHRAVFFQTPPDLKADPQPARALVTWLLILAFAAIEMGFGHFGFKWAMHASGTSAPWWIEPVALFVMSFGVMTIKYVWTEMDEGQPETLTGRDGFRRETISRHAGEPIHRMFADNAAQISDARNASAEHRIDWMADGRLDRLKALLEEHGPKRDRIARLLGVNRNQLDGAIQRYGLLRAAS